MADCGGYYLGRPGQMVRIAGPDVSLSRGYTDLMELQTSVGGGRRAYISPAREPREWQVELGPAKASGVDQLHTVVTGQAAPFGWVTPWGMVTNLLAPEWSTLQAAGLPGAGTARSLDGTWQASTHTTSGTTLLGTAVAVPGRPVCASVYADAGTVLLEWLDAAGAVVGSSDVQGEDPLWALTDDTLLTDSTFFAPPQGGGEVVPGGLPRRWATALPPEGVAFVRVWVDGAAVVAAPAVTWTDRPQPWGIGDGVANVVVRRDGDTPTHAVPGKPDLIRHHVRWTVLEVGSGR